MINFIFKITLELNICLHICTNVVNKSMLRKNFILSIIHYLHKNHITRPMKNFLVKN